jgi:hypothetical protein
VTSRTAASPFPMFAGGNVLLTILSVTRVSALRVTMDEQQ